MQVDDVGNLYSRCFKYCLMNAHLGFKYLKPSKGGLLLPVTMIRTSLFLHYLDLKYIPKTFDIKESFSLNR